MLEQLGLERERALCVIRTAPSYALYLGGSENPLLPPLIRRLADGETQVVVLARNEEQRAAVNELKAPNVVVPERAVDGRSLVAYAGRARVGGRHDEPRGGGARHAGVVDLRGSDGSGRREARRGGAAKILRGTPIR